jgi:hypothetical protein
MTEDLITALTAALEHKTITGWEFRSRMASIYRPDTTAWGILALWALGVAPVDLQADRNLLAADQQPDGRISLYPKHPEAFWPTSLAILAWNQVPEFRENRNRASQFLLKTTGYHFPREKDAAYAHDPSIRGWPWIDHTHSWVIPTSLAIIALKGTGYSDHERVQEGIRLLLDRQLPRGGWNYGNTQVYGQELIPMPESTGVALTALAGSVPRPHIHPSLGYLKNSIAQIRTPLSLGWSLLGLGSWGENPPQSKSWLEACWRRQERYGDYDTIALALMILALTFPKGTLSVFDLPN